jgi:hypothetical protein
MSGYLWRLARRTLAQGPVLRAQAAPFAAPGAPPAATAPGERAEVDAVQGAAPRDAAPAGEAAGLRGAAPREALGARPMAAERDAPDPAAPAHDGLRPAAPLHGPAQPGPADTRHALSDRARPLVPAPLVAWVHGAGEPARSPTPVRQERWPAAPAAMPRAEARREQASRLAAAMDVAPVTAPDAGPAAAARSATSSTPLGTWLDKLTESAPPRAQPTSSPAGPRSAARAAAVRGERAERAERVAGDEPATVHVSIGRIEIAAVQAPPAPAARPAAPGQRPLSLDDYLSRRHRR